ncbi:Interferon-induced GTP-binding protein Mx [Liparis tanakae]|uniref:Interferon-induced GTP-binding protein Mx n=1 Tax=Liparis tanakae TaxID=230148 RepID=A0A4Z2ERC4_9TELE|nr:Interferon-induced GTP-binding protein Mx [Liparis tanakae]
MKRRREGEDWYGKISYLNVEIEIEDPADVDDMIRGAQNMLAGEGDGISDDLISLEIASPDVPDLTLIDLPGITRVAVKGQAQDIGDQIKRLIQMTIKKQETISLVVVPCNVDIATTEALKMAQEVDPDGDRTLGVLTKPDLVDKGTEESVLEIVRNDVIHLKKGYMIVRCRGQKEITEKPHEMTWWAAFLVPAGLLEDEPDVPSPEDKVQEPENLKREKREYEGGPSTEPHLLAWTLQAETRSRTSSGSLAVLTSDRALAQAEELTSHRKENTTVTTKS